jgi:hypothetical protein
MVPDPGLRQTRRDRTRFAWIRLLRNAFMRANGTRELLVWRVA